MENLLLRLEELISTVDVLDGMNESVEKDCCTLLNKVDSLKATIGELVSEIRRTEEGMEKNKVLCCLIGFFGILRGFP